MNGGTTSTVGSSSAAAGSADPRSSLSFYPGGAGGAGGAYPVPPASSSSNSNRNSFAVPVDPRGSASYPMPMAAVNPPSPSGALPYHHASIPSSSSYGQLAAEGIAKPPSSSSPMVVDPSTLSKGPVAEGNTRSPIALPDIPRSFPELEGMTDAQLEKMLRDDAAVAEHVDKHTASVEMMRSMIDDLRQSNADAATANVLMVIPSPPPLHMRSLIPRRTRSCWPSSSEPRPRKRSCGMLRTNTTNTSNRSPTR